MKDLPTTPPDTIIDETAEDAFYFDEPDQNLPAPMAEAGLMVSGALAEMVRIASYNPTRLSVMIYRLIGMSYADIGAIIGIRKQAVMLHLAAIRRRSRPVFNCLRARAGLDSATQEALAMAPDDGEIVSGAAINIPGQSARALRDGLDILRQRRKATIKMFAKREHVIKARLQKLTKGLPKNAKR